MAVIRNIVVRGGADFSQMQREFRRAQNTMSGFSKNTSRIMQGITGALGVYVGFSFFKDAVEESNKAESAFMGLNSILKAQGRSVKDANSFIEQYTADGLIPLTEATTSYKNLLASGFSDTQIQDVLTRLKDSSAFARQGSLSMGEAVRGATEGIKNQNSIMVDNAGVTKNLSIMYKEYAASIGKTTGSLTEQEKVLATHAGIMKETRFQIGDADKLADTFQGRVGRLTQKIKSFKVEVGNGLKPILNAILPVFDALIQKLIELSKAFTLATTTLFGKPLIDSNLAKDGTENVDDLADSIIDAGKAAKKGSAGFDEFNELSSGEEKSKIPTVNIDVGEASAEEIEPPATGKLVEGLTKIRNIWDEYLSSNDTQLAKFKENMTNIGASIKAFLDKHGIDIATWIAETAIKIAEGFFGIVNFMIEHKDAIGAVLGGILTMFILFNANAIWVGLGAIFAPLLGAFASLGLPMMTMPAMFAPLIAKLKLINIPLFTTAKASLDAAIAGGTMKTSLIGLKGTLGLLTSPLGLIVIGIGLIVAALIYMWNTNEWFRDQVKKIWSDIGEVFKVFWTDVIQPLLVLIWDSFIKPLVKMFTDLAPVIGVVFLVIAKILVLFLQIIVTVFSGIVGLIKWFVEVFRDFRENVMNIGLTLGKFFQKLFTGDMKGAMEEFGNFFKIIFMGIGDIFIGFINGLLMGYNTFAKLAGIKTVDLIVKFRDKTEGGIPNQVRKELEASKVKSPDIKTTQDYTKEGPVLDEKAFSGKLETPEFGGGGRSLNTKNVPNNPDFFSGETNGMNSSTSGSSSKPSTIQLMIDGKEMARALLDPLDKERSRIGMKVVTSS